MRKVCLFLFFMLLFSVCAEEKAYYTSENRSWYHEDASCRFSEFSFSNSLEEAEFFTCPLPEENTFLRPCLFKGMGSSVHRRGRRMAA